MLLRIVLSPISLGNKSPCGGGERAFASYEKNKTN